jgi:hypothetical protein
MAFSAGVQPQAPNVRVSLLIKSTAIAFSGSCEMAIPGLILEECLEVGDVFISALLRPDAVELMQGHSETCRA